MSHRETLAAFGWCCQAAHSSEEVEYEYQPKQTVQICPCCHQALPEPVKRQRLMLCKRTGYEIPSQYWFVPPIVCEGVPDDGPLPLRELVAGSEYEEVAEEGALLIQQPPLFLREDEIQ